ncbi:hypothetical protein C5B96_04435 [Subtercola sp. Z020]|uniref:hypothetical protein n=1 Tax=Subtercola sp. Z020 TaxID=2080582 RepID=UPI000CE83865|nr:hypothetical protein [Subtercola sp. Z020]PPF87147.1 hypothetical protein C5B96_04435 [Subtercola sp. Z020]
MTDLSVMTRVPLGESGRREILANKPPLWEFLYLAACLRINMAAYEDLWRDYHFGYSMDVGESYTAVEFLDYASERLTKISTIVSRIPKIISPRSFEMAIGAPGEAGDSSLIHHLSRRFAATYAQMLQWTDEIRAVQLGDETDSAREALVALADQPIEACREFVTTFTSRVEAACEQRSHGADLPIDLDFAVEFFVDPALVDEFVSLVKVSVSSDEALE